MANPGSDPGRLLSGILPVNTWIGTEFKRVKIKQVGSSDRGGDYPRRTSTITIAKEKMSAALPGCFLLKTSGAVASC